MDATCSEKAKISVVIPVYNAEDTIERCITSIIRQDLNQIEIICVDDASSDDSLKVLNMLADQDDRIIILKNDNNKGTLLSRKRGVIEAHGQYIMFADNDDWFEPNSFAKVYKTIKEESADILLFGARGVTETASISQERLKQYNNSLNVKNECYEGDNCLLTRNTPDRLWNKIIRAEICKTAYAHAEDVVMTHAEDTYACWLIHYFAKSFTSIQDVIYVHTLGGGITTKEMTVENFDSWCRNRKLCFDLIGKFLEMKLVQEEIRENYEVRKEKGFEYCVNTLVSKVPKIQRLECIKILKKYYSEEQVVNYLIDKQLLMESENSGIKAEKAALEKELKNLHKLKKMVSSLKTDLDGSRKRIVEMEKRMNSLTKENCRLREKNERITNSKSYIIGRAITSLPRKTKKMIKGE